MDLLIYVSRGISIFGEKKAAAEAGSFITNALFTTITNANFDKDRIIALIREGLQLRSQLKETYGQPAEQLHDSAVWYSDDVAEFHKKAAEVGVESTENEDVRSLRELLIYGLKGIAAYAHHAAMLGKEKEDLYQFMKGLNLLI